MFNHFNGLLDSKTEQMSNQFGIEYLIKQR